jgi:uncharacterized membrane protein YoaK (UPF0700 family)
LAETATTERPPALVALAVASGTADAISYLGLGHVFVANMTGNTVLLGIALATGKGGDGLRSGLSLAGFCIGVAIGAMLVRRRSVVAPLALEVVVLAGLLGGWLAAGSHYVLIPIAACAMGLQSAAIASSGAEVATTYITGTITRGIVRARLPLPGAIWLFYAVAATLGALAQRAWHGSAAVIPLLIVATVTMVVHGRTKAARAPR